MSTYKALVGNVRRFLLAQDPGKVPPFNGFQAAQVLGAAFCKDPREVLADIALPKAES